MCKYQALRRGRGVARQRQTAAPPASRRGWGVHEGSRVFAGVEGGRLPGAYMSAGTSSFTEFLSAVSPELLPGHNLPTSTGGTEHLTPDATTIVALTFPGGV